MAGSARRGAATIVVALAVLALSVLGGAAPAKAGQRLTEAEIQATFSEMTLDGVYAGGSFFSETYFADGTIRYHDPDGADSGEWSVKDGKFCTFYESAQGACFVVERDGANCYSFFTETGSGTDAKRAADWTSRGWDKSLPATCPTAPEIQL